MCLLRVFHGGELFFDVFRVGTPLVLAELWGSKVSTCKQILLSASKEKLSARKPLNSASRLPTSASKARTVQANPKTFIMFFIIRNAHSRSPVCSLRIRM